MIKDTTSDELLTAMESNMVAFWSSYGRAKGSSLHATAEVVWFYTGMPVSLFNGVLSAKLTSKGLKATYDKLQAKIDEQGAPALWWIGPGSKPDNAGSLLEEYGLEPAGETPGMAIDLAVVDSTPETIPNLTIGKVRNAEMQELWGRICCVGMGIAEGAIDALAQLEGTLSDAQYRAQQRYIGFLDGTPVATSALVLDSGVAGIYAVATLPEARRKGIGRVMTVMPLVEAREMGYRVGILQASSMGHPLYRKLGFEDVCRYKLYFQS